MKKEKHYPWNTSKNRHGIEKESASIEPTMVVVHWTAVPTLEATFDVFNPVQLGGRPELITASNLNVSAHFLVDRDGTIFRLLPDTTFATTYYWIELYRYRYREHRGS
jgi:N-acetylmuramoyl-L-alanine amidase